MKDIITINVHTCKYPCKFVNFKKFHRIRMQYHNDKPTTISIKMDKLWKQKLDFVYACTKPQQHWTTAETKSQQEINQLIIYI